MSNKFLESKSINRNILRDPAIKIAPITSDKWLKINKVNREMVEEYLEVNKQLSPASKTQYTTCLKQFFYYVFTNLNDKEFYKITKRDFMKYLGAMQERKLSSSAIYIRKSAVSSFCNYIENIVMEDMEECSSFRNFTRGMPAISKNTTYKKIMVSKSEYELMMKVLESNQDYLGMAWLATAYNVGSRRAEIVQFKTEILNYKMQDGLNYVLSHVVRGKGEGSEGKPLEYMINKEALEYMQLWIEKRDHSSEYIFTVRYWGKIDHISESWANEFCSKKLSPIVVRRINPHLFKSTIVTRLLVQGVDMKVVSKYIAHHKSAQTTEIYDLRDFEEERNNIFK